MTGMPLMVLVAGPYRSGTGGDPEKMAANVAAMNDMALAVFRAGHLPVTGEALALPLQERAGGEALLDVLARRLVVRCDAVLRIGGPSAGCDEMLRLAREAGKAVYFGLDELPLVGMNMGPGPGGDAPARTPAPLREPGGFQDPREGPVRNDAVRLVDVSVLSSQWYVLRKVTFDFRRADGTWSRQSRETYDRGNGAVVLLHDASRGVVLLTRQFRMPVYVNDPSDGMLLEVPGGLLDGERPEDALRREVEEETGVRLGEVRPVFEVFMSPGSVTERLHFFAAPYTREDRVARGGGLVAEGEDIQVVELPLAEALRQVDTGEIRDAKTIMLLQWAARHGVMDGAAC